MSSPSQRPRLIPVIDVMAGQVVRAIGGRREEYRPIASRLTSSANPVAVAKRLFDLTGGSEFYLADLDAIRGGYEISSEVMRLLGEIAQPCWLDVGISAVRPPAILAATPACWPVVATETCAEPDLLKEVVASSASRPVAISLDLNSGSLLGNWRAWGATDDRDAAAVVRTAIRHGANTVIVLDLSRVGTGTGSGTEDLLRSLRSEFGGIDLIAGGGVRTWDDLESLGEAGATGVLVASALHDGILTFPPPGS
jgi:phosphoribosylformimino-5-aminoimidazole carboxamide ribotide isomerase